MRQHLRPAHPARPLQREPVLPAVHRAGRHALRRVRQLQQRRRPGNDNRNQVLLARSTNGGQSFSAPVKVADYYDLPDCDTYQGAGADPVRACVPEKGTVDQLGLPCHQLPVGGGRPHRQQPGRGHLRLLHQPQLQRDQRLHARPGSPPTGSTPYAGVKDRRLQQRHRLSASRPTAARRSPAPPSTRGSCPVVTDSARQASTDQFWQGVGVHAHGHARGQLLRPVLRHRQHHRATPTSRVSASHDRVTFAAQAGHVVLDAAADPVHRAVLSATTSGSTSPPRRRTRSGRTPAPWTSSSAPAPARPACPPHGLHGVGAERAGRQRQDIFAAASGDPVTNVAGGTSGVGRDVRPDRHCRAELDHCHEAAWHRQRTRALPRRRHHHARSG